MKRNEVIVQVMLKPNCGLENTRAALIMRRIASLCDTASCHPPTIKSDPRTITYLRDHGLFIRFTSGIPEQVLLAIKRAFFVDHCTIINNPNFIPPLSTTEEADKVDEIGSDLALSFAERDARNKSDDELSALLARFEETSRVLNLHTKSMPQDRKLNDIAFSYAQIVDDLRTTVAQSRIEPFNRIAPSLHKLVEDYGLRFGVAVDLDIAEGYVGLDRSVISSMEEVLRRVLRSCVRDGIESPAERKTAGKPERGIIRIRIENDGSGVVCRIEHDGYPLNTKLVGKIAQERGLLTRPLETYSAEEIGAFLLLPQFIATSSNESDTRLVNFNETGSMLQSIGGRGSVRNTERGTLEIALFFPVPFTVLEVALICTGANHFALPAQQIDRFEAFHPDRIESAAYGSKGGTVLYTSENGKHYQLLNEHKGQPTPFDTTSASYVILLDALGKKSALAVDSINGYERVSVHQLPALLDRQIVQEVGCIGYAILKSGQPCAVLSIRRLLNSGVKKRGTYA